MERRMMWKMSVIVQMAWWRKRKIADERWGENCGRNGENRSGKQSAERRANKREKCTTNM